MKKILNWLISFVLLLFSGCAITLPPYPNLYVGPYPSYNIPEIIVKEINTVGPVRITGKLYCDWGWNLELDKALVISLAILGRDKSFIVVNKVRIDYCCPEGLQEGKRVEVTGFIKREKETGVLHIIVGSLKEIV